MLLIGEVFMSFRIDSIYFDDNWLSLCRTGSYDDFNNMFSLIVGQNAIGKSRLLRKIVSNYIFDKQESESNRHFPQRALAQWGGIPYPIDQTDVREAYYSARRPENVIAVSTGRHDRFPSRTSFKNKETTVEYHYIGPADRGGTVSSLTRSLTTILEGLLRYDEKFSSIAHILSYLGFIPYLDFKFSLDPVVGSYKKNAIYAEHYVQQNSVSHMQQSLESNYDLSEKLNRFSALVNNKSGTRFEIDLSDSYWRYRHEGFYDAIDLLKAGLVRVSDISLIMKDGKKKLRLSQASSGQQCMLTMILGIAGAIKDGSLICIDEPEISLHPRWQSDIVNQLQLVFSDYRGCHFVIATHSPQIVSGLTALNGFVLNLEEKKLYHSEEYAKRSADFQLAEIFNAPGYNNEYLIRLALTLLTKISSREILTVDDKLKIDWLVETKKYLSDNDPVYHLINQVQVLGQ